MQHGSNVNLLLQSAHTWEQYPEILTLPHFGEWLSANLKWSIHPFLRTMASDLDVLILMQLLDDGNVCGNEPSYTIFPEESLTGHLKGQS